MLPRSCRATEVAAAALCVVSLDGVISDGVLGETQVLTARCIVTHIQIFRYIARNTVDVGQARGTNRSSENNLHHAGRQQGDRAQSTAIAPARDTSAPIAEADLYARFFRVLGDPTRIRLLRLLLDAPAGECSVGELVAALEAPQSRISTHLGCLRWCGLVQARRVGKQVYYRIADPRVRDLLVLAGAALRDHAAGIASCGIIQP